MNIFPCASVAILEGPFSKPEVAALPSPVDPLAPVPADVEMAPGSNDAAGPRPTPLMPNKVFPLASANCKGAELIPATVGVNVTAMEQTVPVIFTPAEQVGAPARLNTDPDGKLKVPVAA